MLKKNDLLQEIIYHDSIFFLKKRVARYVAQYFASFMQVFAVRWRRVRKRAEIAFYANDYVALFAGLVINPPGMNKLIRGKIFNSVGGIGIQKFILYIF